MATLTKQQCREIRVVINRAALGPAWIEDAPVSSSADVSAMHAELRAQTKEWLRANVILELQRMLPANERVKLHQTT